MSGVKAQWFTDDLPDVTADPFEAPVEEVGTPIDLTKPTDLVARLTELVIEEGQLEDAGVRCAIRAMRDSCCSACPVSEARQDTQLGAFCRNGANLERALTAVIVKDLNAKG